MNDIEKLKEEKPRFYNILEKMCEYVGVTIEDIDWNDEEWFKQYEWTVKEQDNFINWLKKQLKSKNIMREVAGHSFIDANTRNKVAMFFVLNYGWKTKPKNG